MTKWLYWFSWIVFISSAVAILVGVNMVLQTGLDAGLYYTGIGFAGLAVSGLTMSVACGAQAPNQKVIG